MNLKKPISLSVCLLLNLIASSAFPQAKSDWGVPDRESEEILKLNKKPEWVITDIEAVVDKVTIGKTNYKIQIASPLSKESPLMLSSRYYNLEMQNLKQLMIYFKVSKPNELKGITFKSPYLDSEKAFERLKVDAAHDGKYKAARRTEIYDKMLEALLKSETPDYSMEDPQIVQDAFKAAYGKGVLGNYAWLDRLNEKLAQRSDGNLSIRNADETEKAQFPKGLNGPGQFLILKSKNPDERKLLYFGPYHFGMKIVGNSQTEETDETRKDSLLIRKAREEKAKATRSKPVEIFEEVIENSPPKVAMDLIIETNKKLLEHIVNIWASENGNASCGEQRLSYSNDARSSPASDNLIDLLKIEP